MKTWLDIDAKRLILNASKMSIKFVDVQLHVREAANKQ